MVSFFSFLPVDVCTPDGRVETLNRHTEQLKDFSDPDGTIIGNFAADSNMVLPELNMFKEWPQINVAGAAFGMVASADDESTGPVEGFGLCGDLVGEAIRSDIKDVSCGLGVEGCAVLNRSNGVQLETFGQVGQKVGSEGVGVKGRRRVIEPGTQQVFFGPDADASGQRQ